MWNDFETTRTAILTFDNGSIVRAEVTIPIHNIKWYDQLENKLVQEWNKNQPLAKHKVVNIHLMRH